MSSILRALKKLEEEGQADDSRRGWPQGVSPYVRLERKGGAGRLWIVGGLLAVAAMLAVVGWVWRGGLSPSADETTMAREMDTPAAVPDAAATAPAPVSVPVPAPLPASPPAPPAELKSVVDIVPVEQRGHAVAAPVRPVVAADAGAMPDKPAPRPAAVQNAKPPVVVEPPRQNGAVEGELPVLETPELALQAVAWSELPAQRVAVLGNRVVKEGDFAFGYTVVRINPDDIVVRKQGISGRILFKGR
ncbi:MAG: general secretion pathway protein GspB [Desulfobulbaceae bacterium]|nr:general secretion pathway protein GspB [Desulfobulbaceae bacterium]